MKFTIEKVFGPNQESAAEVQKLEDILAPNSRGSD